MATDKDFRVKNGIKANGDITTSGSGDLRANERDVIANEIIAGYGSGDALFRTYNPADHLKLQTYDSGASAFTTSLEVMDNKEGIKTYNMFRSGHDNVLFGTNMYPLGNTGSTQANDWNEVFKWEFNQTMSSATSAQYQNFSFSAEVVGRGIQTIRYRLYGRGEYGVQDSNGWWATTFTAEGLSEVSSEDVFLLVYNAGTSLSKPNAKLYYKRTENWELRGIKINSMFVTSNFTFTFEDTNVGETTPTNDGNTGSSDKSPSEFFEARFGNGDNTNNKELYRGLATTNVFFDTSTERMGIGTSSPDSLLHISSATHPSIRITGTDNAGADPAIEMLGQGNAFSEGMQMWYDNGSGVAHIASLYNNSAADIHFHTRVAADRSTSNVRMVIEGDGNVGIGTTDPDAKLHVEGSVLIDAYEQGAGAGLFFREGFLNTAQPSITVADHSGANPDGLSINSYDGTSFRIADTEKMRLTSTGLGIGTTSPTTLLHLDHNVSNPSTDAPSSFGIHIDADLTGSTATGGDREQGGIFVDLDTSATGGDASDEHRPIGVWADVRINSEADPDAVYGIYGYAEAQRSGATGATTGLLRGGYFFAATDETSDHTVSDLTGALGYASIQDAGTVTRSEGLRAFTNVHSGRSTNVGDLRGVSAEVDISGGRTDGSDITTGYSAVFHALLDHNPASSGEGTVTVTNSYLYYGSSSITDSSQVTNNYGIYLNNEDKNYFSGKVGIGRQAPSNLLHIHGNMSDGNEGILITRNDSGTAEDDLLGGIGFDSSDGNVPSSITEASVAIVGYASENHGTGDKGGYLSILLSEINDDDDTTSPEVMRVSTVSAGTSTTLRLRNNNTSMPNDTKYGSIEFYNADASGAGVGATIDALSNGSGRGGYLQFRTDDDGSGSPSVRMTIDESGNVGIGTTSPATALDIKSGGSGSRTSFNAVADDLVVDSTGDTGITISSSNTATGNVFFADSDNDARGQIRYDHAGNTMRLSTSGTERFRIGSSGELGIGGATYGTSGQVLTSGGSGAAPSWTTISGSGSPAGSDGQIQYNNGGSFGGDADFTWDDTNNRLVIGSVTSQHDGLGKLTVKGTDASFLLERHDDSASGGPTMTLYRYSASVADGDLIGQVNFRGEGSTGNPSTYMSLRTEIVDTTEGSKDAKLLMRGLQGNTQTEFMQVGQKVQIGPESVNPSGVTTGKLTVSRNDTDDSFAPTLMLVDGDADANNGPMVKMYRNTSSPADNDELGSIFFAGEDSAGNERTYASIRAISTDVTSGTNDGELKFQIMSGGSQTTSVEMTGSGLTLSKGTFNGDMGTTTYKPVVYMDTGTQNVNQTEATIGFNSEVLDPANNASSTTDGHIRLAAGGYYRVSYSIPINDDGSTLADRTRVFCFAQVDDNNSFTSPTTVAQSRCQVYTRESSGGSGLSTSFIYQHTANDYIRLRIDAQNNTDISTESNQSQISIEYLGPA